MRRRLGVRRRRRATACAPRAPRRAAGWPSSSMYWSSSASPVMPVEHEAVELAVVLDVGRLGGARAPRPAPRRPASRPRPWRAARRAARPGARSARRRPRPATAARAGGAPPCSERTKSASSRCARDGAGVVPPSARGAARRPSAPRRRGRGTRRTADAWTRTPSASRNSSSSTSGRSGAVEVAQQRAARRRVGIVAARRRDEVVGAELAPAGELRGEEAVEAQVVLVRGEQVDAQRQRDLVLGRELLQRRAQAQPLERADAGRRAAQHLDVLAQQPLRLLEASRRSRPRAAPSGWCAIRARSTPAPRRGCRAPGACRRRTTRARARRSASS